MIFPDKNKWESWGITKLNHKFFLLRWQEIFDENIFDSWQVRYSNTKTILNEILDAIEIVKRIHSHHPNVRILIEEAIQISRKDFIISESFPFVSKYLKDLKELYENKVKNENKQDLERFSRAVNVILGNLGNYRRVLFDEIKKLIVSVETKEKKRLNSLTMSLGIELKSLGYSINFLRDSFHILTNPQITDFHERFSKMLDMFDGEQKHYLCQFFISWAGRLPDKFLDLKVYGIELTNERPVGKFSDNETEFYDQDKESIIANVKVKSVDPYSARYKAESILESIFALSLLYQISKKSRIRHDLALVTQNDGNKLCVEPDKSRLDYIRDAKNASESISEFAVLHNQLSYSDYGQLTAALQYHKLSIQAPTDEGRLVNLWIALESLIQDGGRNIIDRICKFIPSSIAIGYVPLMMKSIPIEMRKLWRTSNPEKLISKLSYSNQYMFMPYDMLSILLDEKDGNIIIKFFEFVKEHSLLIFRINNLWEDLFGSPTNLSKGIEKHKRNVEWQIRRIYRARNHVLHMGVCPPRTRQLTQHLHSYFILAMHNLIHDLKRNPTWRICDAFEHRNLLYEHFIKRLKEYNEFPISITALLNPFKTLTEKSAASPAWGNKIEF